MRFKSRKSNRSGTRFSSIQFEALEPRSLLSGLVAAWLGQQGKDFVGVGPNVGPDGYVDAEIQLGGLATGKSITSIRVDASDGQAWEYGPNVPAVNNAEFVSTAGNATTGTLYLSPAADPNLASQTLAILVKYSDWTSDSTTVVAGAVNPGLAIPPPPPIPISYNTINVAWLGQDGLNLGGSGAVHLKVSNLPAGRTVVGGMLNDSTSLSWAFGTLGGVPLTTIDPIAQPLTFQRGADLTTAEIGFGPNRDETGSTMSLRLILDDGTSLITTFSGGFADLGLRMPGVSATSYYAKPGDNLHSIANNYGTVYLAAGTYQLNSPLILNHAVTIVGAPGATLLFSQAAGDPAWTTAIKIHASNTTLQGFAVRFSGPIEWAPNISYGPAVIGATDNYDVGFTDPLYNLTFRGLDLQSPPASSPDWEEAVRLFRFAGTQSGVIENNTLKGGTTEFFNGPWTIRGNTYLGTMPGTYSYGVFAGHYTHDVEISGNIINGESGASGKTWRFVVLTQASINDTVANNTVTGIGPRDNDTLPNPNSPETIVTEAYRLHFEGAPAAISSDGLVVQIPYLQGEFVRTGDVVAILSGPDAGQWRLIRQALSSTAFLLDRPINPLNSAISIATGIVNLKLTGNAIDSRGSSKVDDFALAGNLFGTTVTDNLILGGKDAIWIEVAPTEIPNIWGWSHAPILDLTIRNNLFINSIDGGVINVEHGNGMKSNKGRVYLQATISDNLIIWTSDFLQARAALGHNPIAFSIGNSGSIDPGEAMLTMTGNKFLSYPGQLLFPSLEVASGTINQVAIVNQSIPLTGQAQAVAGVRLVNDDGVNSSDKVTTDPRITFDPYFPLLKYEYSLSGPSGPFIAINLNQGTIFRPVGLVQGNNTVTIRALDGFGITRDLTSFSFTYNPAPLPPPPRIQLVNDTGILPTDRVTQDATLALTTMNTLTYEYSLSGTEGTYLPVIFGSGSTFWPSGVVQGNNTVYVRSIGPAGNRSPASSFSFVYDSVAPGMVSGLQLVVKSGSDVSGNYTNDGRVKFDPVPDAVRYEYSMSGGAGTFLPVSFTDWMAFMPAGLVQGNNTVFVRAVDSAGNLGPAAQVSFIYDTVAPGSLSSITAKASGLITFETPDNGAHYQYRIGNSSNYIDVGSATSFKLTTPSLRARKIYIRAIDRAGNAGPEKMVVVPAMGLRAFQSMRRALALKARQARLLRMFR